MRALQTVYQILSYGLRRDKFEKEINNTTTAKKIVFYFITPSCCCFGSLPHFSPAIYQKRNFLFYEQKSLPLQKFFHVGLIISN
jgi:hypothetical protein